MKKQIWILTGVLFLIIGVAIYLVQESKKPERSKYPDRDFATENIEDVHRIFMADKKGKTIDLKKDGDKWILNDQHEVFFNSMEIILRTLKKLRVKYIPPKAAEELIIKNLAASGIKVELYDKDNKKMKVFYVGGNTSDDLGTAFIMEGYDQPYVLHMQGQVGGIRTIFDMKEENLIDRWIFKEEFDDIESVSLEYPSLKNKSFILERTGNKYSVKPYYDITPEIRGEILPAAVEAFLSGFSKLGAEAVINSSVDRDSVLQQIPFVNITVISKKNGEKILSLYPIYDQISEDVRKVDNVQYETFVERYFASSSNGNFYMTQHIIFGKILWAYEHFYDPTQAQIDILN